MRTLREKERFMGGVARSGDRSGIIRWLDKIQFVWLKLIINADKALDRVHAQKIAAWTVIRRAHHSSVAE
jgi:hypothetical protein